MKKYSNFFSILTVFLFVGMFHLFGKSQGNMYLSGDINSWGATPIKTGQRTSDKETGRNFFMKSWKPKYFQKPVQYLAKPFLQGETDATVTVFVNDSLHPILPIQLGVNTTFRSGVSMVDKRIPLYQKSGWGVYRFPAGSGSNTYFWDGNLPDSTRVTFNPIDGTKSKHLTPAGFATFKKGVNGEATVVVNYFYARYGITPEGTRKARVLQAAKYAAGFVRRMNVELGANIKYWEIGNECYGKWETGYIVDGVPVTGKEYGEDLCVFAKEMKKVDTTIKVGAVVYSKDGDWNREVLQEIKNTADFLVVHDYFTAFNYSTYHDILASLPQVGQIKNMLDSLTETIAGKPRGYFPIAMTEYNNRGNLTTTMANAVFVSEIIGELMRNGYGMATLWVNEFKWTPGTHSVLAVSDPDQSDYSPRQAYMAFRYYHSYFGDELLRASSDNDSVKVYASRFSNKAIGIAIINEASIPEKVKIKISGLAEPTQLDKAFWYEIYANNIDEDNKKFYINGQTGLTRGGGPENFDKIKPYGADFENNFVFETRQYSINFMVVCLKDTATQYISPIVLSGQIKVYPNPIRNILTITGAGKMETIQLINMAGKVVFSENHPIDIINIKDLKKGLFILKIRTSKGDCLRKIIKL